MLLADLTSDLKNWHQQLIWRTVKEFLYENNHDSERNCCRISTLSQQKLPESRCGYISVALLIYLRILFSRYDIMRYPLMYSASHLYINPREMDLVPGWFSATDRRPGCAWHGSQFWKGLSSALWHRPIPTAAFFKPPWSLNGCMYVLWSMSQKPS